LPPAGGLAGRVRKHRVLVASNRGPVSYQFGTDGSLTGRRGGGGMIAGVISGLAAVAPEAEVTWICAALSDADRVAARSERGDHDEAGIPVRMLDIPPGTFGRAYNNVANSALWFLLHQLFDTPNQPQFGAGFRRDWESYVTYNEMFADALAEEAAAPAAGDPRILVQDYHLCLVPRLLRERLGHAAGGPGVGYFCHTPWAPPDSYRLLPADTARPLHAAQAMERGAIDSIATVEHIQAACEIIVVALPVDAACEYLLALDRMAPPAARLPHVLRRA